MPATTNVTDTSLSFTRELLDDIVYFFSAELTETSFWTQVSSVLLAVAIAIVLAGFFGRKLALRAEHFSTETLRGRLAIFALTLSKKLLFSVFASFFLFLGIWFMQQLGLVQENDKLTLARLVNQVFFMWAILVLIVEFIVVLFAKRHISTQLKRFFYTVFWILAILNILGVLPVIVHIMESITLPIGSSSLSIWSILVGLITVLLAMAIANWLSEQCETMINSAPDIDANLKIVLSRLATIAFFTLAILISLTSVGLNLTVLSVFGGAVGVGLGFGLQKIASNYISGFIILFDRSVKIGDLVEVAGFSGTVTQINTRYSVIQSMAGEEMIIPNENFVTGTVKNLSRTEKAVVHSVSVSIGYECDVSRAQAILLEIVGKEKRILKKPAPWAVISNFGADGIDLRVSFWVQDPEKGTSVLKSNIMKAVLSRFNAENISIPYAIRDVRINGELRIADQSDSSKK